MESSELAFERLRDALATLDVPVSMDSRADIEARVCEYVDSLRALDWPPERIIVAVKRAANEAGFHASRGVWDPSLKTWSREELLTALVGWCIAHYFRAEAE
jgi:hypothetical protein